MTYLFDNSSEGARERLRGLEQIEDANTIAVLERLPRLDGAHCLELGAGAGSIAAWLAKRVGPDGRVLATDIDVSHLDGSGYDVLRHDVRSEEFPCAAFDLVHVRHVLIHLPDPIATLQRVRLGMRRGAQLIVEESDLRSWVAEVESGEASSERFNLGVRAVLELYSSRGMNVAIGATLPEALRQTGFEIVDERSACRLVAGGSAEACYQRISVLHLIRGLKHAGAVPAAALTGLVECLANPALRYRSRTTVTVTARAC